MKAITIWQPWASLKAINAKEFETRGWATSYRGPIAIHAGKGFYGPYACELPNKFAETAAKVLWPGVTDPCVITDNWDELPRGAVIAVGELVNIWYIVTHPGTNVDIAKNINIGAESLTTDRHAPDFADYFVPTEQEILFGDWTPGRYAWEIVNVKLLPEPIPARGQQGLWNWEPPV